MHFDRVSTRLALVAPPWTSWKYALTWRANCQLLALVVGMLAAVPPAGAQLAEYVIGSGDVLTIAVYEETDLSGKYEVEADGAFSFPLIGRVSAAGLTARAVETELKKRLADGFFKNPQLTVTIEQYRSQRVFIVGQVAKAGTYPLSGQTSLLEALSLAGSVSDSAGDEVVIVRPRQAAAATGPLLPGQSEEADVIRVDLRQLQSGALSQGTTLRDGDTIFVPKAESVYVFGQVKNPGAFSMQRGTTVLQALSLAGGVTDRGATNRIRIIRIVDGVKKELKVQLSELVQPGDTIIVRERFF